jgi:hypothetical protein
MPPKFGIAKGGRSIGVTRLELTHEIVRHARTIGLRFEWMGMDGRYVQRRRRLAPAPMPKPTEAARVADLCYFLRVTPKVRQDE